MAANTIAIKATDLTKGMTVYREARSGQWKPDFRIGDLFTTSGPGRLQPLAFNTTNGVKVFAHCATVRVGTGNERAHKVSGRPNGKARRKNRKVGIR